MAKKQALRSASEEQPEARLLLAKAALKLTKNGDRVAVLCGHRGRAGGPGG